MINIQFSLDKEIIGGTFTLPVVTATPAQYQITGGDGEEYNYRGVSATRYWPSSEISTYRLTCPTLPEIAIRENDSATVDDGYIVPIAIDPQQRAGDAFTFRPELEMEHDLHINLNQLVIDAVVNTYNNIVIDPDSLLFAVFNFIYGMVENITYQEGSIFKYSSLVTTYGSEQATPNSSLFCKDIDFSCVAFTRREYGVPTVKYPPVLIHPEFIVHAYHTTPNIGDYVVFRAPDGSFHRSNVLSHHSHLMPANGGSINGASSDMGLSRLETPITGVPVAMVMSSDYKDYIPSFRSIEQPFRYVDSGESAIVGMPLIGHRVRIHNAPNRQHFVIIQGVNTAASYGETRVIIRFGKVDGQYFTDDERLSSLDEYYRGVLNGDSSSPYFFSVSGRPVLVALDRNGTLTSGVYDADILNSAINTVKGTSGVNYLDVFDFSPYRSYA